MIYIGLIVIVVVNAPPQSEPVEVAPEVDRSEPEVAHGSHYGYCPECGWQKPYPTTTQAKQALGAHKRWCKGSSVYLSGFSKPY